jgi:hypothetical protein
MPAGRPSKRTPTREKIILKGVAKGESLRKVCKRAGIEPSTFFDWIKADDKFHNQYARAKEIAAELMADEILQIADDTSEDELFVEQEDGSGKSARRTQNSEFINRARLRVDSRKWLLSKLLPKKYGDKLELSGDKDSPLTVVVRRFTDADGVE